MAQSKSLNDEEGYIDVDDSSTEQDSDTDTDTDDSEEEDPNYDILEDTCKSLSNLSLKKSKSKSRISKVKDSERKRKLDFDDVVKMPEFDEKDEKSFETVEEIIKAGQLEKLKVDQCKVYLRKYGLRLTGTKDILIERIREHLGIMNGGGELKYPTSSFVLNCKGDACTGDVVMFEQNVYEMYNIASRSASGPPCGTRIVVGRIVKESYGAAKQQHTFTIEVLWSKGEKPLPPLHQLLIKGRNLYRLNTVRQKWTDEAERSKVLLEKHSRGSLARSSRETRIQGKENRKLLREQRALRNTSTTIHNENQHRLPNTGKPNYLQQQNFPSPRSKNSIESAVQLNRARCQAPQHPMPNQPNYRQQQKNVQINNLQKPIESTFVPIGGQQENIPSQRPIESSVQSIGILTEINQQIQLKPQRDQILPHLNNNVLAQQTFRSVDPVKISNSNASRNWWGNIAESEKENSRAQSPLRNSMQQKHCNYFARGNCKFGDTCKFLHDTGREKCLNVLPRSPLHRVPRPNGYVNRQHCPFFSQGKCHYGDRCKYLHVYRREQRY